MVVVATGKGEEEEAGGAHDGQQQLRRKKRKTCSRIVPKPWLTVREDGTTIEGVNAVALLNQGKLVSAYLRPSFLPPREEKVMQMLFQVELVRSIADTQSDIFGPLDNLTVEYKDRKVWVFKSKYGTLTFSTSSGHHHHLPLDHEQVIEQVRKILKEF
jgi:hypothetical protein